MKSLVSTAELAAIESRLDALGLGGAMATEIALTLDDARRDIERACTADEPMPGTLLRACGVAQTVELFLAGQLVPTLVDGDLRFTVVRP